MKELEQIRDKLINCQPHDGEEIRDAMIDLITILLTKEA